MRILIDLVHLADLNFFKHAALQFKKDGHEVVFSVLRRGRLPEVAAKEFPGFEIIPLGHHRTSLFGKMFGMVQRELLLLTLCRKRRFDVVAAFGFYPGLPGRLTGARAVQFHDDKEYRLNFTLTRMSASRFISLCPSKPTRKTFFVKSFKELASLHPSRLEENTAILRKLGLTDGKYVYVRDITAASLNYKGHKGVDLQPFFDQATKKGHKIVYNAESEHNPYRGVIPIIARYTYKEITALKKHAALVISSGDTELREAALLGTPVIYTSPRDMAINRPLKDAGLYAVALTAQEVTDKGLALLDPRVKADHQKSARSFIKDYEDMTAVIIREVSGRSESSSRTEKNRRVHQA